MNKTFTPGAIIKAAHLYVDDVELKVDGSEMFINKKHFYELGKIAGRKTPRKSTTLKGLIKRLK